MLDMLKKKDKMSGSMTNIHKAIDFVIQDNM